MRGNGREEKRRGRWKKEIRRQKGRNRNRDREEERREEKGVGKKRQGRAKSDARRM